MFTGIVQGTAKVVSIDEKPIFAPMWWSCLSICWPASKPGHRWRTTVAA
jgi:hypothetical protein